MDESTEQERPSFQVAPINSQTWELEKAELVKQLKLAKTLERMGHQCAARAEAGRDEADARLAHRDAEIARLNANGSKRYADLLDQVTELERENERLKLLVGEEGQPGWDNCSRAEAIRQATEFHEGQLKWLRMHDERRDERDALERWRKSVLDLCENTPNCDAFALAWAIRDLPMEEKPDGGL